MCLRMIPWWCTVPRSIPTLLFTIRRRGTTPRGWRSRLALASPWGRSGAAAGAGAAAGVVTMTSPSTETTISTGTRTSVAATVTTSAEATARRINHLAAAATGPRPNRFVAAATAGPQATSGSTDQNIAAVPRMETAGLRIGLAAPHAAIRSPTARPAPGNRLAGRAAICPAAAARGLA